MSSSDIWRSSSPLDCDFGLAVQAAAEFAHQANERGVLGINLQQHFAAFAAAANSAQAVYFRVIPQVFVAAAFPPDRADLQH